jgi:SAM-dependent methyltransferase
MLPFENARFDRVCTINTIYFWTDPLEAMNEINRVLRPGGRFVLSVRPVATLQRFPSTRYGFVLYEPTEAESLLARAGFQEVRVELHKDRSTEYICIVAVKTLP